MRRIRNKHVIVCLTVLLLSLICSMFVYADKVTPVEALPPVDSIRANLRKVDAVNAPVHAEAKVTAEKVASLEKGSLVLHLETEGVWSKISYYTDEKYAVGWVLSSYLVTYSSMPGTKYIVNASVLNVRSGPNTQSQILRDLKFNDIVTNVPLYMNQKYETQGWMMICFEGSYGWVSKQYVQKYEGHLLRHTAQIEVSDITVTGQKQDFTVDVKYTCNSDGVVTVKSDTESVKVVSSHQIRIKGKYDGVSRLTFQVPQTEKYTAAEKRIVLTVKPRELDDPELTVKDKVIRAEDTVTTGKITYSCKSDGLISMSSSSEDVKVTSDGELIISPSFAGTATITVQVAATEDYKADKKQATVTVRPWKPSGLSAKTTSTGKKVKVTWKKAAMAEKVGIYVSKTKNFSNVVKKKAVKASKNSYVIKGLPKGTYYVRICGFAGNARSKWSKTIRIKIKK